MIFRNKASNNHSLFNVLIFHFLQDTDKMDGCGKLAWEWEYKKTINSS